MKSSTDRNVAGETDSHSALHTLGGALQKTWEINVMQISVEADFQFKIAANQWDPTEALLNYVSGSDGSAPLNRCLRSA